jgi:hypothetical protein
MGKILKRARLQELEEINKKIRQENVELRILVQILEEDRERLRSIVIATEERPTIRSPSSRIPGPIEDDKIHPFCKQSD